MASLTDLFNPTFFMFLGILVLAVALIVVYFESKIRDQNHKIASMLSLVSTLAEDMNGVKMGLNHLAITRVGGSISQNFQTPLEQSNTTFISKEENKLIDVSDDEEDDEDEEDEEDDDDDDDDDDEEIDLGSDSESDSDSNYDDKSKNNIKILKINISSDKNINDIDESNLEFDKIDNFDDLEELDDNLSDNHSESGNSIKFEEKLDDNTEEKTVNEILNISSSDLKTININLEESHSDTIDYKKFALPKLRSIVSEKGLSTDTSKMKKNELFKLLGVE
jgi:hypothetical protein